MQDFLKDRPVVALDDAKIINQSAPAAPVGGASPFGRIMRDASALPPVRPPVPGAAKAGAPGNLPAAAAHTSQVKTIVENGRVTRLVVTCSCGKVTEVACGY